MTVKEKAERLRNMTNSQLLIHYKSVAIYLNDSGDFFEILEFREDVLLAEQELMRRLKGVTDYEQRRFLSSTARYK